ncbi:MAG: magnesium/cobalt transporter CorA [Saprospiraceae bacterium]|nr:magnesium/cobalt transporter CorA [Saprospiraceae bacterium]
MSHKPLHTKKNRKRPSKTGLPPGTHIYTGKNIFSPTSIEVYAYDSTTCQKFKPELSELLKLDGSLKLWININGLSDVDQIRKICEKFGVHYLYQEDILNVFQRPKLEEEENYIFVTLKALEWDEQTKEVEEEQMSVILTSNAVITFQEKEGDGFQIIRERLETANTTVRERPIDYLFYRILDVSVDIYFDILEKMGDYLEEIENEVLGQPDNVVLLKIQNNKKDIMQVRKNIYPMRDVLNKLISSDHPFIHEKTKKYFRDVLDHTIQILETVETYRDTNFSLKDIYLNAMSHEMNRIMKILTIISTFFIPLTFIVGVYGMNFKYMPELNWINGYYLIWGIMLTIVVLLTYWFKRKGWF